MQPSIRHRDWEQRFNAERERQRNGGLFIYGQRDCCLVAADFVKAITGWDPAAMLRGTYRDEREAVELIRDHGGLQQMLSDLLDCNPSSPNQARRGDVVLLEPLTLGGFEQVGVCLGNTAMVVAECGVLQRPMSLAICCWMIG